MSDDSDKVLGFWKTAEPDNQGRYDIVILSKDKLNLNGSDVGIYFETVSSQINVMNSAHKNTIIAISDIEKDSAVFDRGPAGGKKRFIRTTESDAKGLIEARKNRPPLQPTTFPKY